MVPFSGTNVGYSVNFVLGRQQQYSQKSWCIFQMSVYYFDTDNIRICEYWPVHTYQSFRNLHQHRSITKQYDCINASSVCLRYGQSKIGARSRLKEDSYANRTYILVQNLLGNSSLISDVVFILTYTQNVDGSQYATFFIEIAIFKCI